MPGIDDLDDSPEDIEIAIVEPQYSKDATHILERWDNYDYKYVEVGRAHSEEEALREAQKLANKREYAIRVRLSNSWDD